MSAPLRRVRVSTKEWVHAVPGKPGHHIPKPARCAVFHCWGVGYEEFETGAGNFSVGIVEFPDGSIESVLPHEIKFEVDP